jgi:hypothetical protein
MFYQVSRIHDKIEPWGKLWTFVNYDLSDSFVNFSKQITLMKDVDNKETHACVGRKIV